MSTTPADLSGKVDNAVTSIATGQTTPDHAAALFVGNGANNTTPGANGGDAGIFVGNGGNGAAGLDFSRG